MKLQNKGLGVVIIDRAAAIGQRGPVRKKKKKITD
jgi:hypothetical protein